ALDLLGKDNDRARSSVVGQVVDEVLDPQPGFVAGRDGIGKRKVAVGESERDMPHERAALRHQSNCRAFSGPRRSGTAGEANPKSLKVVRKAETVWTDKGEAAFGGKPADHLLLRPSYVTQFGKTRCEDDCCMRLPPDASRDGFPHSRARHGADDEVDSFGQIIDRSDASS